MPDTTDDNCIGVLMDSIKSREEPLSLWEKLTEAIESSNIDMPKLIKDSLACGLEVGLFKKRKGGKITILEGNDNNLCSMKHKLVKKSKNNSKLLKSMALVLSRPLPNLVDNIISQQPRKHVTCIFPSVGLVKTRREYEMKSICKEMVRPVPICTFCLGDEFLNNHTKKRELMISCWDCGTSAHPNCLRWPGPLLEKVRTIRWQCLHCKYCSYCCTITKGDDDMLLCDGCDRGFHLSCFNPPITILPKGQWMCPFCQPLVHNTQHVMSLPEPDFNYYPNCQIISADNVKWLSTTTKEASSSNLKFKSNKTEHCSTVVQGHANKSRLHITKKKLIVKAIRRQTLVVNDGLLKLDTSTNIRQSQASHNSLKHKTPKERKSILSLVQSNSYGIMGQFMPQQANKKSSYYNKMSTTDQSSDQSVISTKVTDPYPISDLDRQWFSEIQHTLEQILPPPMDVTTPSVKVQNKKPKQRKKRDNLNVSIGADSNDHLEPSGDKLQTLNKVFPPRIQIGAYIIDTWYTAPYPSEYARLNVLYICEYCLKHIKSYDVYVLHMEKCTLHFPPGNEIYRNGDLSVFEVDGYVSKIYCQQLCLLAKLFLDHKTLYYDVEPFLFYVAIIVKNHSCHIIGYFSKEKRSTHKYNLSCIMVLPPYQKFNYGRFLIEFSYLLSRHEGQSGSPEKPLSTLGRFSYESYWKSKLIPYLSSRDNVTSEFYRDREFSKPDEGLSITIEQISTETGINPHDIASIIQMLSKTVDLDESDRVTIQLDWDKIKEESEKYSTRYHNWIPLDEDCLRWAPLMQPNDKIYQFTKPQTNRSFTRNEPNLIDHKTISNQAEPIKKINTCHSSINKAPLDSEPITTKDLKLIKEPVVLPIIIEKGQAKLFQTNNCEEKMIEKEDIENISPAFQSFPTSNGEITKKMIKQSVKKVGIFAQDEGMIKDGWSINKDDPPITVDLTHSDNSDDQENDDCVIIESVGSTRHTYWRKSKPVLEMFKESFPKFSNLTNTVTKTLQSATGHEPAWVSINVDLCLSDCLQPLVVLEKCDLNSHDCDVIDLHSHDPINDIDLCGENLDKLLIPFVDLGCRDHDIMAYQSYLKLNKVEEGSVEKTDIEDFVSSVELNDGVSCCVDETSDMRSCMCAYGGVLVPLQD